VQIFVYELLPNGEYSSNSNAAAQAVANRASIQGPVPLPTGPMFDFPGAAKWAQVEFASSMP